MTAIDAYLPLGLTIESLVAYTTGVVTFVSLMTAWSALIEHRPAAARIRAVAQRRTELQAAVVGGERRRQRAQIPPGLVPLLARRLHRLQASQVEKIRSKLMRSGIRSRESIALYAGIKLVCPVTFAVASFVLVYGMNFGQIPLAYQPLLLMAGILTGFFLPDIYLSNTALKRRQALQKSLPDGLDLLVICAEAGLSLDTSLSRVADEMTTSAPELSDELALTGIELNFLPERRMALANLAKRINLPAIRGVVNTLIQTERYGTPLAQSLRVLSAEFREQRMLRAEEKAARLPATLTVPMILFILPTLFIVLVGPAMLDVYDHLSR